MKVGDRVNYHSIIGGPVTSVDHVIQRIDRLEPWGDAPMVAWISDKFACVSLDALTPVENASEFDMDALKTANCAKGVSKMVINKEQREEFEKVCKPLMAWLSDNCHPHTKVVGNYGGIELVEDVYSYRTEEFTKD